MSSQRKLMYMQWLMNQETMKELKFWLRLLKKGRIGISSGSKQSRTRNKGLTCNALFGLGMPKLVVIARVVALIFGPKKLLEVSRSIGKTIKSFQQACYSVVAPNKSFGELE